VIDGDTIEVREAGSSKRVRYIGIDTPERVDCYYRESTAKNAELVAGKEVRMEKDISETDRFGRLLRYVYIDETFVNAELVRLGYAAASTIPPDVRNADLFVRLAREAREGNRGLWDSAVCPNDG
jgi:micrococcal nuclease